MSASFRYLEEGRLFRLEKDPALWSSKVAAAEYFWLCPSCSSTMTLHLSEDGSVIPVVLREPVHNSGDFISANRHRGLLLSGFASWQKDNADGRDPSADGEGTMPDDWDEHDDVAAGSSCPMPDCGALAVAYRSADGLGRDHSGPWEFTCPRCGIGFTMPDDELIFQSVPKEWLLARV